MANEKVLSVKVLSDDEFEVLFTNDLYPTPVACQVKRGEETGWFSFEEIERLVETNPEIMLDIEN